MHAKGAMVLINRKQAFPARVAATSVAADKYTRSNYKNKGKGGGL